ncbi:hypothetical protein IJJ97_02160 [bacterium]|nr:hypothetical protein [bacterium]
MIYGEDKNRDGFCKYLTGQGEAIDLVLENHKDIKDGEVISNAWKQMITKKALMGYRQGLINVGEIKE